MEERLREGLSSEVDRFRRRDRSLLGPPRLGPAVRKRVRRRQLGTALVSLILAAGLAFGGVQAVSAFTEGSNQKIVPATQPPPSGTQQAPVGWPTETYGGDFKPEVDHERGEKAWLLTPKYVVGYGTVSYLGHRYRWS